MEKAKNAIKWIDTLATTKLKQGKEQLGNEKSGFCCLGLGCHELDIPYDYDDGTNSDFMSSVGLKDKFGSFYNEDGLYTHLKVGTKVGDSLVCVNDFGARFKSIAKFLKKKPEYVFEEKVAIKIKKHYETEIT